MNTLRTLVLLALWVVAGAETAAGGVVGAQLREWEFTNGRSVRDGIFYLAPGPFHVQLEYWDVAGDDFLFRPEVGLHLRDPRRSVYTLQWRHERDAHRSWLGTEQILARGLVGRGQLSPIVTRDSVLWAWDTGADFYWGSYHLAGATLVRDPREGGLWAVPMRVRLATERNDWIQVTLAPASRRTIGWAADAKWRIVRLGFERNSRFDFTELDNIVLTAGVEVAWTGGR